MGRCPCAAGTDRDVLFSMPSAAADSTVAACDENSTTGAQQDKLLRKLERATKEISGTLLLRRRPSPERVLSYRVCGATQRATMRILASRISRLRISRRPLRRSKKVLVARLLRRHSSTPHCRASRSSRRLRPMRCQKQARTQSRPCRRHGRTPSIRVSKLLCTRRSKSTFEHSRV